MILKMNQQATAAAWQAMREVTAKGRSEARHVARIQKALKVEAMKAAPEDVERAAKDMGKEPKDLTHDEICDRVSRFSFAGGSVELSEEQFEFLVDAMDEILDKGIPGERAASFGELVEVVTEAKAAK
jgi:hypothetical protein